MWIGPSLGKPVLHEGQWCTTTEISDAAGWDKGSEILPWILQGFRKTELTSSALRSTLLRACF